MPQITFRTLSLIVSCLLVASSFFALLRPVPSRAQTSSLFQGYNPESPFNSLFNGDTQKDNGLFTTPPTQLGGATPYYELIEPERSNDGGPTHIMLTSRYEPSTDLTMDDTITLTVTVKNVGDGTAKGITLHATLQDKNAALVADPAPIPPFDVGSSIDTELKWSKLAGGAPFDLDAGASADFTWSFKANKNDSILRWRIVAEFGAGESILLQWIPIRNPNPQSGGGPGGGGGGSYTNPCAQKGGSGPFPDSMPLNQIVPLFKQNWNIELISSGTDITSEVYRGLLKAWWEVLTVVECTPFLTDAFAGKPLQLMAIGGSGGGWWGEYMGNNVQNMWVDNIRNGTVPHIKQNLIHELGHVWRGGQWAKYTDFENNVCGRGSVHPYVSVYGGTNCSENMAEIVGYYVQRDSNEWGVGGAFCATKNPYDWNQAFYYDWAKRVVFNGQEYGPPPPNPATSC
jgi:hypothetical protein